jgi:hypothetical protein
MKRVAAAPAGQSYVDEALTVPTGENMDDFVHVFASKIPKTHGAPHMSPQIKQAASGPDKSAGPLVPAGDAVMTGSQSFADDARQV